MADREVQKLKIKYINSFWLFLSEVLKFPDVTEEAHKAFCEDLQKEYETFGTTKTLRLLPRGYFKSTIVVIAFPIWILFKDPNETILICGSKLEVAQERLLAIEYIINNNALLQSMEVSPGMPWSAKSMRVHQRFDFSKHEDSITIGSVDSTNIGGHFGIRIFDDVVDDKNYLTEKGRAEVMRWWRMLQPLCLPGRTKDFGVGTPYPGFNLYDHIEQNHPEFNVIRRGYNEKYERDLLDVPNDSGLLFPTRLTHKFVEEQLAAHTAEEHQCFYYCSKSNFSDRRLNINWLRMIDARYEVECPGIGRVTWSDPESGLVCSELVRPRLSIDPSLAKKQVTDAMGVALWGWGRDGYKFLIESWRMTGGVSLACKQIVNILKNYGVYDIGIEKNGVGGIVCNELKAELYEAKMNRVPIKDLFARTEKKKRIEKQIQGPARRNELFVLKGNNKQFLLEYELFPDSPSLDVLDAGAMGLEMPNTRHPLEIDILRERKPAENFWDIHPSKREQWVRDRMGRPEAFISLPGVNEARFNVR